MFKLDLEKAEEPEIKLPTSAGSLKKQENPRKTSTFALLTTLKPLTVWITTNYGKFWKRWEYQTIWPASWEICIGQEATVRTGHGTADWFQIGKGVCQGCILSPCLFNLYAEYIREGNGSPLQYSCLENPMDREAWRATVHGVTRVRHDLATKPPPPHFSYGRNRSAMSLQASPSHTYQFLLVVKFTFLRSGFYYPFNYQACI